MQYLDFEKNVAELESKVSELRQLSPSDDDISIDENIKQLEQKANMALEKLYATLSPWQKTKVARHPDRPHFRDYLEALFDDFIELAGDRKYSNDHAIIGGLAKFGDTNVMVIGHEKGSNTTERIKHNFGMAGPEGYRKAERLMSLIDLIYLSLHLLILQVPIQALEPRNEVSQKQLQGQPKDLPLMLACATYFNHNW